MKLSLKIRDEQTHHNPLLKAKVPITVVGMPLISGIIAGDTSDLSFNLATNFSSGPSVKLSYTPTTTTTTTSTGPPFTLSLKSGVGLFGSPRDSPLIISTHFNLFSSSPNQPIFSLHLKPQFGHFSLQKSAFSHSSPKQNHGSSSDGGYQNGFLPDGSMGWTDVELEPCGEKANPGIGIGVGKERPLVWRDLTMESCDGKDGILSGVKVRAKTVLPLTSKFAVNFRWGVNFPADIRKKLPFMTVDKIGIERVEKVELEEVKKKNIESGESDVELMKGMWNWMRRDLEVLQKENWELKQSLEQLKFGVPTKSHGKENFKGESKSLQPSVENSGDFERWRSKKNGGEDNGSREFKTSTNRVNQVESELQKAIKAASS